MKNLKPEMIEKAKAAKSAEELFEIAKANNVEMTDDEAKTYFAQLGPKSGELDDNDLDAVAGGGCDGFIAGKKLQVTSGEACPSCGATVGTARMGSPHSGPEIHCDNCDEFIAYVRNCKYVEL